MIRVTGWEFEECFALQDVKNKVSVDEEEKKSEVVEVGRRKIKQDI